MSSADHLFDPSAIDSKDLTNHSLSWPWLALNDTWILPIFILCLLGLLFTIIISFIFICLSFRRFNGHFLLTNLFICFSVCFIYIIIIFFLIRANELFCGLREFLSQLAYALLYSALLCRYIMQWLGSRILSKRTKQLTSLLIYVLLIVIQIPIGILWWYFTIPRRCQQSRMNVLSSQSQMPEFRIEFRKPTPSPLPSCSNRCLVDYRFYATFTYTILELFFCTIIATCLFLCCHCHRNRGARDQDKSVSINGNNALLTFLNMFAFILIDLVWLTWTCIYYFSHPFFIFPALILGMFLIATICLLFILLPQIYYYSKIKINEIPTYKSQSNLPPSPAVPAATTATLYSNKLASNDDVTDREVLLQEKSTEQKSHRNKKKQQTISNGSDLSYELGASGTFLPITRTPKGPFKLKATEAATPSEKLDQLIYGKQPSTQSIPNHHHHHPTGSASVNDMKVNGSLANVSNQQETSLMPPLAPLQRQLTSSSIASDFVTPVMSTSLQHRPDPYRHANSDMRLSSSMYYPSYSYPRRDETIIPILCNTERPRTSTPVQMRIMVNSPSSSVPTTRRIHSGTDLRHVRHPLHHIYPPRGPPPPPPPTAASPYYSPQTHQQYLYVDPYRTMPSRLGGNTWHSVLLQPPPSSGRHPYPYRRFHAEQRSLSQRLWDIDSGDDDDDGEEDIIKVAGRVTPSKERLNDFPSTHADHEENILLHIDDDTEEDSYGKQYAHV